MRILALAALVMLAGCMEEAGPFGARNLDCSSAVAQEVDRRAEVLYPAAADGMPSPAANPSVTIHVRAGQLVVAQAVWSGSGPVGVAYDGPEGNVTSEVPNVWQTIVESAPEGNITLGLRGDPVAFAVTYTLQLSAVGCTPR